MNAVIAMTGQHCTIQLSMGKVALVSPCDYELVAAYRWTVVQAGTTWYAYRMVKRSGKQFNVKMHRFILGLTDPGIVTDHANGDGLDNRRENIRACTQAENTMNSCAKRNKVVPAPRGITWNAERKRWEVEISANGQRYRLGKFRSLDEAIAVREAAKARLHGEFACGR